jgi:hypothetical protein
MSGERRVPMAALVMRTKEFFEDNIERSSTGIISNAIDKDFGQE